MALATTLLLFNFTFALRLMRLSACMLCVGVCAEEESCVCVRGRRWRCSRIRRVSGAFATSSTGQLAAGLGKEEWRSTGGGQ